MRFDHDIAEASGGPAADQCNALTTGTARYGNTRTVGRTVASRRRSIRYRASVLIANTPSRLSADEHSGASCACQHRSMHSGVTKSCGWSAQTISISSLSNTLESKQMVSQQGGSIARVNDPSSTMAREGILFARSRSAHFDGGSSPILNLKAYVLDVPQTQGDLSGRYLATATHQINSQSSRQTRPELRVRVEWRRRKMPTKQQTADCRRGPQKPRTARQPKHSGSKNNAAFALKIATRHGVVTVRRFPTDRPPSKSDE